MKKKDIGFYYFLTPYRDWQGCVLHFLTWGSGRFARWQSLSFTSVMVLLIIRVQDTMVFRSPTRQIKNNSEKGNQWLRTKPCQLVNQNSKARSSLLSPQDVIYTDLPPLQAISFPTSVLPSYHSVFGFLFFFFNQKSYISFPNDCEINCFTGTTLWDFSF